MVEQLLPKAGSIVVCKTTQILNYGVFVELLDYGNVKGFVHISQVASSWIKNIRNFVKENQLRAAYVLSINMEKGQIDLSFTKLSQMEEQAFLQEWRMEQKNKRLIEMLAQQNKKSFEIVWSEIAEPLAKQYGSVFAGFQSIALNGEKAVVGINPALVPSLVELVKKNIDIPRKTINGTISINSLKPNGVEIIQDSLLNAVSGSKDAKIEIFYTGGGKYSIKAVSHTFKICEKAIVETVSRIEKALKSADSKVSFEFSRVAA